MADARQGKGPHFALVPHDLVDDDRLGAREIALYAVLKRYADFPKSYEVKVVGGADPGSRTLATRSGMSRPTVRRARERLREAGWISYLRRPGETPLYFLHNGPLTDEEREFWTESAIRLRLAWEDGGAEALLRELEAGVENRVDNPEGGG